MNTRKVLTPSLFHNYFGELETIWQSKRRTWGVRVAADVGSVWSETEENLRARPKDVTECSLFIVQTVLVAGLKVLHSSSA